MPSIDLNCDMGEGMLTDAAIMPYISSANIACGYHAGNDSTMQRTIELALKYGVAIGAHPGFADRENFGRVAVHLTDDGYYELICEQLYKLQKQIDVAGAKLHHVKPHGALYNTSAKDSVLAAIIARAVKDHNPALIVYGLSGSYSITTAATAGLCTAAETFADRTYMDDGSLTPRSHNLALITTEAKAIAQVLQMIQHGTVTSITGKTIPVHAETICVHGDGAHAENLARRLYTELQANEISLKSVSLLF